MTRPPRWPFVVAGSAALLAASVAAGAPDAVRVPLALWLLLVCTGMSFVPLLPVDDLPARVAAGLAVSVALDVVAVTALLVAGAFSPLGAAALLTVICGAGCGAQLHRWAHAPERTRIRTYGPGPQRATSPQA